VLESFCSCVNVNARKHTKRSDYRAVGYLILFRCILGYLFAALTSVTAIGGPLQTCTCVLAFPGVIKSTRFYIFHMALLDFLGICKGINWNQMIHFGAESELNNISTGPP
jgi:hypothetical protein